MTSSQSLVWLITGVNSGFGEQLCLIARAAGHTVIGTVRSQSKFPSSLASAGVVPLELSIPAPDSHNASVVSDIVSKHGRIDVLVNNAGYGHMGAVEEATDAEVKRQLDVNLHGPLSLIRAVLPHMRSQKSGTIINVSSIAGFMSFPGAGIYSTSKYALEGASEALASELAPLGVRVHIVEPGYFRTNFLATTGTGGMSGEKRIEAYGDANAQYAPYHANQPGDPKKGMQRLYDFVTGTGSAQGLDVTSLVRLPLGSDCMKFIDEKMKSLNENFEATRKIAMSTDLDA